MNKSEQSDCLSLARKERSSFIAQSFFIVIQLKLELRNNSSFTDEIIPDDSIDSVYFHVQRNFFKRYLL